MRFNSAVSTVENLDGGITGIVEQESPTVDEPVTQTPEQTPENDQLDGPEEQVADDELETEQVEEQMQADGHAIEDNAQDGADLENAAERLEELQEQAQGIVTENGHIGPSAARIIEATTESIMRRLGVEPVALPTVEAFGGKWTAKDASRLTLEALDKAGTNIGARVISSVKLAFKLVMNFLTGVLKNRSMLEARIKKAIARCDKLERHGDFTLPFLVNSTVDSFRFRGNVNRYTIKQVMKTASLATECYGDVQKVIQSLRDDRPMDPDMVGIYQKLSTAGTTTVNVGDGDDDDMEVVGAFPGGRSFYMTGSGDNTRPHFTSNSDGFKTGQKLDALDPTEIKVLLNSALDAIQGLRKVEAQANRLGDAVKGIIRRLETAYAELRGAMGSEKHAEMFRARRRGFAVQAMLNEVVGRFPAMTFQACLNAVKLAEQSISNIK